MLEEKWSTMLLSNAEFLKGARLSLAIVVGKKGHF
jgi:hypothetical protein